MSTFSELKRYWNELRADAPGARFARHHERMRSTSRLRMIAMLSLGALLVFAGFVNAFVPGPGGILLTSFGLVLMASASRRVARALDRAEPTVRRLHMRISGKWPFGVAITRVMLVGAALAVSSAAVMFVMSHA